MALDMTNTNRTLRVILPAWLANKHLLSLAPPLQLHSRSLKHEALREASNTEPLNQKPSHLLDHPTAVLPGRRCRAGAVLQHNPWTLRIHSRLPNLLTPIRLLSSDLQ
jgi:hypothetical protein